MWRLGIFMWLVASGSVLAEVPESTLVEQMAAEKLARGLEMQRLEMRLICASCRERRDTHGSSTGCRSTSRDDQPLVWGIPAQRRVRHRERKARTACW